MIGDRCPRLPRPFCQFHFSQASRRVGLLSGLAFLLSLAVCYLPLSGQGLASQSSLTEIEPYGDARRRSVALREGLEETARSIAQRPLVKGLEFSDLAERVRGHKKEYFALREALFRIVWLHSSAIVERTSREKLRSLLSRTSLSLMAATHLVENFHAVAALLSASLAAREVWNEADQAVGIAEGSWEISVQAYRNANYQDLFRQAIERLTKYQRELEAYRREKDNAFLVLYPNGAEARLQEARRAYQLMRAKFAEEDLSQDERELRALVERSKTLRARWAVSAPALREAIARDKGLIRGNVHVQVHQAKREYLDLREGLYHLSFKHVAKLTRPEIPYPKLFRLRAIAVSLLAAVTLYENAHQLQSQILTIPGVKALLNQGDLALGVPPRFWDNIESEFTRVEYRSLLEAGIQVMEQEQKTPAESQIEEDPLLAYVTKEISTSAALAEIRGEGFLRRVSRGLRRYAERTQVIGMGTLGAGKFQLSKGFGNLVGMIEFRKGKLFNQPYWVRFVKERLEPGDLLLEKTPFKLTDQFIPGHFGHVAMYVGTEAQLRQLGLWNHPWVAKYRKEIGEGRVIVEALRDGTQINTIERFLNIDDIAILRPKKDNVPNADVAQAIALAFSHIGKKYDFDFDNNTWDTIVCSELAFHSYVNIKWPFAKMLSSYTISPDDIAVVAGSQPSRPFDLVTFVHDGQVVHDRLTEVLNEKKYVDLIGKRYAEAIS